jgi:hypothetical protein
MALLTPQEFVRQHAENQAKLQKAALDYAELVKQYDALAKKIIDELLQVEADLNTLQGIQDMAHQEGKENEQRITSFLGFTITGNIATTMAHVRDARQTIVTKG